MGLLKNFYEDSYFKNLTDEQKRVILDWTMPYLSYARDMKKNPEQNKISWLDVSGKELLDKIELKDVERLIQIRKMADEAVEKSNKGNSIDALNLYKEIVKLAPWDDISLMSIGVLYAMSGDFNNGLIWLEKAIHVNPENQEIQRNYKAVKEDLKKLQAKTKQS